MKNGQFSHKGKKKKNWKNTFWIAEKTISVELSAPKQYLEG